MNWIIRIYNKKNRVINRFIIENRTEHEAENEASYPVNSNPDMDDWTMMPIEDEILNQAKQQKEKYGFRCPYDLSYFVEQLI